MFMMGFAGEDEILEVPQSYKDRGLEHVYNRELYKLFMCCFCGITIFFTCIGLMFAALQDYSDKVVSIYDPLYEWDDVFPTGEMFLNRSSADAKSYSWFPTNRSRPRPRGKFKKRLHLKNHIYRVLTGDNNSRFAENINTRVADTSKWHRISGLVGRERRATESYKECKKKQKKLFAHEALLLREGQTVTFKCNICIKPGNAKLIEWKRQLLIQKGLQPVEPDGEKVTLLSDTALHIRDLKVDDTGTYICYKNDKPQYMYHLDVVKYERTIAVMESGIKGKKPKPDVKLKENNLHVFTLWAEWNRCNRCNNRGQRRRLGICQVKKLDTKATSTPEDVLVLNKYIHGMPCRSYLLPDEIKQLVAIKGRASEIIYGYCWEPCPTVQAVKKITDSSGKVIEVVKSGQGIISLKDSIPTFPPLVKRKTIYIDEGKKIKLECPTDKAYKSPVRWQNGTQVVNAATIKRTTRGRVNIDVTSRLVIRKLRLTDTAPYSCWISGRHVATIKIRVTVKVDRNLKDYVVFAGVGVTLLALLTICIKMVKLQNAKGRHGLK